MEGGQLKHFPNDKDQARRMFDLVTKVDVAIKYLPETTKSEIRLQRQELLLTLPARRVWMLLKTMRNIRQPDKPQAEGAEDIVANGTFRNSPSKDFAIDVFPASHLFKPHALTRAMYLASRTEDLLATNPDMGLVKELTLDAEGMRRLKEEKYLVFERSGEFEPRTTTQLIPLTSAG